MPAPPFVAPGEIAVLMSSAVAAIGPVLATALVDDAAGALRTWVPRVALALVGFALCWALGGLAARVLRRAVAGRSPTVERFAARAARLVGALVGIALAFSVLGLGAFAAGLLASSSVVAIVLGFAFQEIGTNLVAGVFLAFDRPFKVGDIIEVGGHAGVVRGIDLRTTHIRSADGRDVFVPNAVVFSQTLVNYTVDDLRRLSFTVGIRYEDDAGTALERLTRVTAATPGVLDAPAPNASIAGLEDSVVRLEVAYWVSMNLPLVERAAVAAAVQDRARRALVEGGYTVSANVTTALELAGKGGADAVALALTRDPRAPDAGGDEGRES